MKQAGRLHEMIKTEIMRKRAEGEPFEEPGSAGLTPPFAKPPAHSANVMPDKKVTSAGLHSSAGSAAAAATVEPMAGVIQLPAPLDYEPITLLDKMPNGVQISYTDCMESSCLRFMQAMCCDAKSLDEHGRPTRVDLDLVGWIVPDLQVRRFFKEYPEILSADEYAPERPGYTAREAWARLVTHRPFFTYKRSACGVYKNEWLEGEKIGSFRWATEMEPCVHNVISLCRHFLGVTFAKEDLEKPMWNRRCDTNHEALNHDVSGDAQLHLSAAMHQLSRPGIMELQARVQPPRMGGNFRYDTDITFDVNGLGAWTWRLRRKFVLVPPEVLQELGGDGNEESAGEAGAAGGRPGARHAEAEKWARIRTSWHSEINVGTSASSGGPFSHRLARHI